MILEDLFCQKLFFENRILYTLRNDIYLIYNINMENIIQKWTALESKDELFKESLLKSKGNEKYFTDKMKFGTAGLRGIMGAGSQRINEFTISAAAEAYAIFLKKTLNKKNIKIIIANDNRHNGDYYKNITAKMLQKYGIKAVIMPENKLMATPLLSYLIREMKVDGGINITASHNPKEYNGFKVYNHLGGQLMPEYTKVISEEMNKIDIFNIKTGIFDVEYIPKELVEKYITNLISCSRTKEFPLTKVVYSPLHGTGIKIGPKLLSSMKVNFSVVDKQMKIDPNFSDTKSPNPEDDKAYDRAIKIARKKKANIIMVTDPDADRLGVVVKHQRRYKYISGNELATLYLDYLLKDMINKNGIPKNAYIIKSFVSTNLINKIADKYNVKVIETNVGFKNIAEKIENAEGTFIFGFEESYGMLLNEKIARDKDAFQAMVGTLDLNEKLLSKNKSMYQRLKEIHKENGGIVRNNQFSKVISLDQNSLLFKRILKSKKIGNKKIIEKIDFRKKNDFGIKGNFIKIKTDDGTSVIIRPSGTEPKTKIYTEISGKYNEKLMDIIYKEKMISNFIDDSLEVIEEKSFSWKIVIKYTLFIAIMIGIMIFVFTKIYASSNETGNIFDNFSLLFKKKIGLYWVAFILTTFTAGTISAWMRKRLISFQGQNVKMRHLLISSYMGSIVSYVTPFSIGGDAIGYWYLRRKGFERGPLAASFISSTIVYQICILLQSAILIPVGLPIYKMVFYDGSPESHAALIMFIINVSWDVFATIMILTLSFSRIFQEFCVRNTIKLLEWFPLTTLSDPAAKSSSYQYEFRELRIGMKKIWESKLLLGEIFIYELIPRFLMIGSLFLIGTGIIKDDLPRGAYWSQVIATDLASTANSMSVTPGGSGTSEWLNITVNKFLYKQIGPGGSPKMTASSWDLLGKIIYSWPKLIISVLLIVTVLIGEKRRDKYMIKAKNSRLNNREIIKGDTTFYKWITIPWALLILTWLSIIAFVI